MATLTFNGESFTVDHAAKGADYIHGYDADGVVIVSFDGIKDFSGYSYDGTYMNPSDCLAELCNDMVYCGGLAKTRGGAIVPASAVGLGNVNNTSDANKPVSTAQATAIADAKAAGTTAQSNLSSHTSNSTVHITAAERTTWNGKANGTHTHTKSQITDFPSSMPASDVYSWAKASSKPSYTYSEVGAAPSDHAHKLNWTRVWQNSSTGSSFAEQTVSIDLSGYTAVVIMFCRNAGNSVHNWSPVVRVSTGNYGGYCNYVDTGRLSRRFVVRTNGIYFENAGKDGGTDNSVVIPYQVYAIY